MRKAAEEAATGSETERELEQRLKRAERGAEREEIMDALDVLASWYRDLVVIAAGAEPAVLNCDRLEDLSREGEPGRSRPAEQAAEPCTRPAGPSASTTCRQGLRSRRSSSSFDET